jgi:hypothetical protein
MQDGGIDDHYGHLAADPIDACDRPLRPLRRCGGREPAPRRLEASKPQFEFGQSAENFSS